MRQLLLSAMLLAAATTLHAQQPTAPAPASPITDHFAFRAGIFYGTAATTGEVDDPNAATPGTPFSLEDDFKLGPKAHQARAEFMFRMRERGRLRVDMWELNRSGVASPQNDIVYGGNTFCSAASSNAACIPGNADVVYSKFNWQQVNLTWTYSFLRRDRFELGAGLGLHLIQAEAEARVPANANHPQSVYEDFTGAGPFVTLALDGTWRITRRFALSARGQYFKLKVSSVKGSLGDYHGDVQFRWRPNLAFGLGYLSTQSRLEVTNDNPNGFMQLRIHGPELFVRASF